MAEFHVRGSRAKIEARQIHKLWRSLELRICNFLIKHLTTSTICRSERTAFVVFLEKSKVRIPLLTRYVDEKNCNQKVQFLFFASFTFIYINGTFYDTTALFNDDSFEIGIIFILKLDQFS